MWWRNRSVIRLPFHTSENFLYDESKRVTLSLSTANIVWNMLNLKVLLFLDY